MRVTVLRGVKSLANAPESAIDCLPLSDALTQVWGSDHERGAMIQFAAPLSTSDYPPMRLDSRTPSDVVAHYRWCALAYDFDVLPKLEQPNGPWEKETWWRGAASEGGPDDDPSWRAADWIDNALDLARSAVPGEWGAASTPSGAHLYLPTVPLTLDEHLAAHEGVAAALSEAGLAIDPNTIGRGVAWRVFAAPRTRRFGRDLDPVLVLPGAPRLLRELPRPPASPESAAALARAYGLAPRPTEVRAATIPTFTDDVWDRIHTDAWYGPIDPEGGAGLRAYFEKRPEYADLAESMENQTAFDVPDGLRNSRLIQKLPAVIVGLIGVHRRGISTSRVAELAWSVMRLPLQKMADGWGLSHASAIQRLIEQYAEGVPGPAFPAIINYGTAYLIVDRPNQRLVTYSGPHLGRAFRQIHGLSHLIKDREIIMDYGVIATGHGIYGDPSLVEDAALDQGFFAIRDNGDLASIAYTQRAAPLEDPDKIERWEELLRLMDPPGRLRSYLSIVGDIGAKAPILLLQGSGGAGKSFVASAIRRYFRVSDYVDWPATKKTPFGWQALTESPVVLYEEATKLDKEDISSLKERSMASRHAIQIKFFPQTTVHAYLRIVITTNEPDVLRIPYGLGQEVIEPLRRRLLAIAVLGDETAEYLSPIVDTIGSLEAAHEEFASYIASIQRPRSEVGDEALLAIDPMLAEHMYGGSRLDAPIFAAIASALVGARPVPQVAYIDDGAVWVAIATETIHAAWRSISRDPCPTVADIGSAVPWYKPLGRKITRERGVDGSRTKFGRVAVERIAAVAEQRGLIDRAADFFEVARLRASVSSDKTLG